VALGAFHSDAFSTDAFNVDSFLFDDVGVIVPDVIGQSEASATTEIEGEGLTVSVTTAYSAVVAAGLVISQVPTSGTEVAPGSNVAIVVSLGSAQSESGGGGFFFDFEYHNQRRRMRQQELDEIEDERERIADKVDREIALLIQSQEKKDAERQDIERLKGLVKRYQSTVPIGEVSDKVSEALKSAQLKQSRANLERLQREFDRMAEEEDFMAMLLMIASE
jgi:flagellar biosynthesis regulator FlaF